MELKHSLLNVISMQLPIFKVYLTWFSVKSERI